MSLRKLLRIFSISVIFACAWLAVSCQAEQTEMISLSFGKLDLKKNEQIVSFTVTVRAGSIASIEHIPPGWSLNLDNDASWTSILKATTTVGAASLSQADLSNIQLLVKKNEFGDIKFGTEADVAVTADYATERTLEAILVTISPKP